VAGGDPSQLGARQSLAVAVHRVGLLFANHDTILL
jgi:hypothetical protein